MPKRHTFRWWQHLLPYVGHVQGSLASGSRHPYLSCHMALSLGVCASRGPSFYKDSSHMVCKAKNIYSVPLQRMFADPCPNIKS